jgi:histidine triad (HIT) family protein
MVDLMSDDCIFCAIVAGQAEASFVGATERTVAFLDILPVAEGHALVVPRRHVVGLAGLDAAEGAEMFQLAREIASTQRDVGLAQGVNLFFADGEVAGQEVFHAHLHVVARSETDGMRLEVDYPPPPDRAGLDATAARLRTGLPKGFRNLETRER